MATMKPTRCTTLMRRWCTILDRSGARNPCISDILPGAANHCSWCNHETDQVHQSNASLVLRSSIDQVHGIHASLILYQVLQTGSIHETDQVHEFHASLVVRSWTDQVHGIHASLILYQVQQTIASLVATMKPTRCASPMHRW